MTEKKCPSGNCPDSDKDVYVRVNGHTMTIEKYNDLREQTLNTYDPDEAWNKAVINTVERLKTFAAKNNEPDDMINRKIDKILAAEQGTTTIIFRPDEKEFDFLTIFIK